jgi:hypothetical protein
MTTNFFNRLLTEYCVSKIAGKPHSVKQFFLDHTMDALIVIYRHAGRMVRKVFSTVETCLDFCAARFNVMP